MLRSPILSLLHRRLRRRQSLGMEETFIKDKAIVEVVAASVGVGEGVETHREATRVVAIMAIHIKTTPEVLLVIHSSNP